MPLCHEPCGHSSLSCLFFRNRLGRSLRPGPSPPQGIEVEDPLRDGAVIMDCVRGISFSTTTRRNAGAAADEKTKLAHVRGAHGPSFGLTKYLPRARVGRRRRQGPSGPFDQSPLCAHCSRRPSQHVATNGLPAISPGTARPPSGAQTTAPLLCPMARDAPLPALRSALALSWNPVSTHLTTRDCPPDSVSCECDAQSGRNHSERHEEKDVASPAAVRPAFPGSTQAPLETLWSLEEMDSVSWLVSSGYKRPALQEGRDAPGGQWERATF